MSIRSTLLTAQLGTTRLKKECFLIKYSHMGILFMTFGSTKRRLLLSSSNLIGRHWRCDTSVIDKRVPLYWVEIRWFDTYWGWRPLSSNEQTRGSGARMENGWRKWNKGKISLGESIFLELTEASPPTICFERLQTKERKTILDMDGRVVLRNNMIYHSDDDQSTSYEDGSVMEVQGFSYRVHIPKKWVSSNYVELDISHHRVHLDIDIESLKATFTQGKVDCQIYGEPVRLLCAYAKLRQKNSDKFFSSEEIFEEWCVLGGTKTSPIERMNWERAKIKNMLSVKQVANVEQLFMRKKAKRKWLFQLGIHSENISIL